MKIITWNLCAATLALGTIAVAQNEKPKGEGQPGKGMPVAAVNDDLRLYKLGQIDDLDLKNGADKSIGEIDGIIIDSTDGRIAYALVGKGGVLGIGETEHIVPWESIRFDAKDKEKEKEKDKDGKCVARTTLTAEQIEKAPVFRKADPLDAELERRVRESAGLQPDSNAGRGVPARFVCSSDLKGCTVRATDNTDVGKIEEVVISPKDSCVAYTVLATGGMLGMGEKHCALPWQMTEVSYDKDQKLVLRAPLTKERLAKAPEFDSKDKEWKRMCSTPWIREVCTYWEKEPFWSRTAHAGSEKQSGG